jgi:ubiquinone/menaquinone biosynthesis C-methylase UbiE
MPIDDPTGPETKRQPHAVLDVASRRLKGLKIERLLNLAGRPQPMRMLEIGTGSGGIANYFGTHSSLDIRVEAVDVVDNRLTTEGYNFCLVTDTSLPFADESFDVVLTNHVIEHVGDQSAQLQHLQEIQRVMRREAVGYVAVPNRWQVVEPHYKLAFLSWLPRGLRSSYLQLRNRGKFYDCEPLTMGELEALLQTAGFNYTNLFVASVRVTVDIERPNTLLGALLTAVPDVLLRAFRRIVPTLIFRFERP